MNGASNQLLPGPGLAQQQDGGVTGSNGLDEFKNIFQRGTFSDDVLETHLAANFFLEVELLLSEYVLKFRNLLIRQRVFNCDRYRS